MKKYSNKEVVVEYQGKEILDIPTKDNDVDARTIGEYLVFLLDQLWAEGEGFSGKRPFGNSGWEDDLYNALAFAHAIKADFIEYEEGEISVDWFDVKKANKLVREAIASMYALEY